MTKPTYQTEVIAHPENDRRRRRNFSAEQKLRIHSEADGCKHGELGALLRREGIYSSQLAGWRRLLKVKGERGLHAASRG